MKVLVTADYDPGYQEELGKQFEVQAAGFNITNSFKDVLQEDALIEALQGKDILIVGYEQITPRVIAESPDLKLIASIRGGPEENIDIAAATAAGLPIIRTLGRTQRPVSEQTILSILALARPFMRAHQLVRSGKWTREAQKDVANRKLAEAIYADTTEVWGKTLGMIGMGNIGEAVARLAKAFGMKVLVYDPYLSKEKAAEHGVELVSALNDMVSVADFVTVHARVTPESIGVMGREQFRLMKPTACFVNTARGALVDQKALVEALQKGWIRAAAIDVYDPEPPSADDPIFSIPPEKLFTTCHLAGFSQERIPYHSEYLNRGIVDFLHGRKNPGLFDLTVFDQPTFASRGGKLWGIWKQEA